jgi:ABC-type glycerol-3-phosphate transport system substrate-binding protein
MTQRYAFILLVILFLAASACQPTPTSVADATAEPASATATDPPVTPQATATFAAPTRLTLWVAPFFAPSSEGDLLTERLVSFEVRHPGINVEIRVKAESGEGGLLDSLISARAAAPQALPDVVLLDQDSLRNASTSAILATLEPWSSEFEEQDWYGFAQAAARLDGRLIAYPAGGLVDVLAYRVDLFSDPPRSWDQLLESGRKMLFPAGDTRARYALADYLARGGTLRDANGNPSLNALALSEVLNFYSQAMELGVIEPEVRQFTRAAETWVELQANRAASASAPLAAFIDEADLNRMNAIPQPTQDGRGVALTTTWSWSLIEKNPLQVELAAELIAWLADPAFLGEWTYALGILPTSSTALAAWPDSPEASLASSLVTVAQSLPEESLRTRTGPLIENAVEAVLEDAVAPTRAAQTAVESLQSP